MDAILRNLDKLQGTLYDLEEYLETHRDNEVIEFLSDHWKECLLGVALAGFAIYKGRGLALVSIFILFYDFEVKLFKVDNLCLQIRKSKNQ